MRTRLKPLGGRRQPPALDAPLWRRPGARGPHRPARRRTMQVIGIAPTWLDQNGSPTSGSRRFNEANPPTGNFGWNAIAGEAGHRQTGPRRISRHSSSERCVNTSESKLSRLSDRRPLPSDRARDGGCSRLGPRAALDSAGDRRNGAARRLRQRGQPVPVRAEARQREIAVRIALGGNRRALVRTLVAEALVLSAIGSVVGVLVSAVSLPALLRLAPETVPRLDQVRIDGWVLLVATAAAVVSALLFGLGPAIRYTRPDVLACLRHGGRSATDHPGATAVAISWLSRRRRWP